LLGIKRVLLVHYNFEWDVKKAKSNFQKHRISFERAAEIFLDPFMLSVFDKAHSKNEERWITIGKNRNNISLVVVHTFQETNQDEAVIRIISARKSTRKEEKQYNKR
jgi:uncharacterized DUF497 family protein